MRPSMKWLNSPTSESTKDPATIKPIPEIYEKQNYTPLKEKTNRKH